MSEYLDLEDLTWSLTQIHIKSYKKTGDYMMEVEHETNKKMEDMLLNDDECENLASFCRSFLHAWEFAQQQEGQQND